MKKKIKLILTIVLVAFIVAVAGGLFYFRWAIKTPVDASNGGKSMLVIQEGDSRTTIARGLIGKGLIRSGYIFILASEIKDKSLLPGMYSLSADMSIIEILDAISTGEAKVVKVLIPEGYRSEQIAQVMAEKGLASYGDFIARAKEHEGFLFPDTYFFTKDNTIDEIIKSMTDNYRSRIAGLSVASEDLIIASIVEREAIKDEERPMIAGVYKNRIARKMKLEADPTVQYSKDSNAVLLLGSTEAGNFNYWKAITSADYLTVASPYNTYTNIGLPPGPICNPGLKSIEATLSYSHHNYLYFMQAGGQIYFAVNSAGHERNKALYLR
jgi:UPF0755 protein